MDHPPRKKAIFHATAVCTMPRATQYVFSVAAGILPAVEPGILPGGMGVWFEKSLPFRTSGPGGKVPPSTAAKMAAATDVNPALNTYPTHVWRPGRIGGPRVRVHPNAQLPASSPYAKRSLATK